MDANVKTQWLAALRGDVYKQGTCKLRASDCYCVWGVLCDIVSPATWTVDADGYWKHDDSYTYPSYWVRTAAGINEGIDYLKIRDLLMMNDAGRPFAELANYIEDNL